MYRKIEPTVILSLPDNKMRVPHVGMASYMYRKRRITMPKILPLWSAHSHFRGRHGYVYNKGTCNLSTVYMYIMHGAFYLKGGFHLRTPHVMHVHYRYMYM